MTMIELLEDMNKIKNGILSSATPKWFQEKKLKALNALSNQDLPTKEKSELWRYNNLVASLENKTLQTTLDKEDEVKNSKINEVIKSHTHKEENLLIFYNGVYQKNQSKILEKEKLALLPIKNALKEELSFIKTASSFFENKDPFESLNEALFEEGVAISIAKKTKLEKPIHFLYVSENLEAQVMLVKKNTFYVQQEASCEIIETYYSTHSKHFTNHATDLIIKDKAKVRYTNLELEAKTTNHVNFLRVHLEEESVIDSFFFQNGGRNVVSDVQVAFSKQNAKAFLNGISLGKETQNLDQRTTVEHQFRDCESMQQYRNVLKDRCVCNFTGKIVVFKDAQKTNANKLNKNLLLSPKAQVNTRPQLEIHADDVKCTHGATLGQPSLEEVFYLQSRGLSKKDATELLAYGFIEEIVLLNKNSEIRKRLKKSIKDFFTN